jgi:hypothetical protein
MAEQFRTRIATGVGKDTAGIEVPPEVVEALGRGKRPAVKITIGDYAYRSTIATMGGKFMIGLSQAHRQASGCRGGEDVLVTLEVDTEPRTTDVPTDLAEALRAAGVLEGFEKLAPSRKKEFVRQVEEAKAQETRERRIAKIVETMASA